MGSTCNKDATTGANVQEALARLQLQGLQAGGMHVGSRHIEIQLLQAHRGVGEGLLLVGLRDEMVPGTHPHCLDG